MSATNINPKRPQAASSRHPFLFWLILLTPLAALLALALPLVGRLVEINVQNPEEIASGLEQHLSNLVSDSPEIQVSNGTTSIRGEVSFVPVDPPDEAEHVIFVFGASSVVLPSPDVAFAARLEERLNRDATESVRVVNLGRSGATSGVMLATVRAALAVRTPDLVVLYEGHNDYNYAYRAAVLPAYGLIEGSAVLNAAARAVLTRLFDLDANQYWAMRTEIIDPRLGRWLQRMHMLRIEPSLVDLVDAAAQDYLERNFNAIIAEVQKLDVPVLLVTPISNLEFEPFGVGPEADIEYRAGMNSAVYPERLAHLQRARDLDAFNGAKRAKSGVGDFLRRRAGPAVYVLDLEQRLIERQFEFGWDAFVDAMHMTPQTHVVIAAEIHSLLVAEDLCCGSKEAPGALGADGIREAGAGGREDP